MFIAVVAVFICGECGGGVHVVVVVNNLVFFTTIVIVAVATDVFIVVHRFDVVFVVADDVPIVDIPVVLVFFVVTVVFFSVHGLVFNANFVVVIVVAAFIAVASLDDFLLLL